METRDLEDKQSHVHVVAAYIMWIISFVLIALGLFPLNATIVGLMEILGFSRAIITMLQRFGFFGLAFLALGLILYLQHFFLSAPSTLALITRFAGVLGVLLLFAFLMDIPVLVLAGLSEVPVQSIVIAALKLLGGIALIVAARVGHKSERQRRNAGAE